MSYFKIEKSGCCEHKGLCQVRADFYYDESDKDYKLTLTKIYPPEGYRGTIDENGNPVDLEDYEKWEASLPEQLINDSVFTYVIYFEPYNTDEEILFCFELVNDWWKRGEPLKNVMPIWKEYLKKITQKRIDEIRQTDFLNVNNSNLYSVK